jgi:hypothetical protein
MHDQPPPKPYGPLKLYALNMCGLHRTDGAGSWQLVREFDPISHARVLAAAERMPDERAAYVLHSERWAWELITESEGTPIIGTFSPSRRRRGKSRR